MISFCGIPRENQLHIYSVQILREVAIIETETKVKTCPACRIRFFFSHEPSGMRPLNISEDMYGQTTETRKITRKKIICALCALSELQTKYSKVR